MLDHERAEIKRLEKKVSEKETKGNPGDILDLFKTRKPSLLEPVRVRTLDQGREGVIHHRRNIHSDQFILEELERPLTDDGSESGS